MGKPKFIDATILEAANSFDSDTFYETIRAEFTSFPDSRRNQKRVLYPAWLLLLVALCGFFCGCNTISEIHEYAELQQEWFRSLLGRPFSLPSYNTFWWFFSRTSPGAISQYMQKWFIKLPRQLQEKLLALDGKRLRSASFMGDITHVVELFAADDRVCLAMEKVPDKQVEKSALPNILKQVDVSGAIISADAHFTVAEVARQIVQAGADYILAVKENQPTLSAELENFFDQAHKAEWMYVAHSTHRTVEKGHGRIETREVWASEDCDWLPERLKWEGLHSVVEVRTTRENMATGHKESSRRMYISSRPANAKFLAGCIRGHWSIENSCHWVLDVVLKEDQASSRVGHSATNLALIRRLAMNIAAIADPKRGMASLRRCAAFGNNYLNGILGKVFCQKTDKSF
jgi:predicted transposase YbfD/YdcC